MPEHEIQDHVTLDDSGWLCKYDFFARASVNLGDESVGLAPHVDSGVTFEVVRFIDFRFGEPLVVSVNTTDENAKEISDKFHGLLGKWEMDKIKQSIVDGCMEKYFEKKRGCQGRLKAVP